jgi:FMN reductase
MLANRAAQEAGKALGDASELAVLLGANVGDEIALRGWSRYPREFAGNATRAVRTADDIDFDSPLMRLAAGGQAE